MRERMPKKGSKTIMNRSEAIEFSHGLLYCNFFCFKRTKNHVFLRKVKQSLDAGFLRL